MKVKVSTVSMDGETQSYLFDDVTTWDQSDDYNMIAIYGGYFNTLLASFNMRNESSWVIQRIEE